MDRQGLCPGNPAERKIIAGYAAEGTCPHEAGYIGVLTAQRPSRHRARLCAAVAVWLLCGALATMLVAWGSYWIPWGRDLHEARPEVVKQLLRDDRLAWPHPVPILWPATAESRSHIASLWVDRLAFTAEAEPLHRPPPWAVNTAPGFAHHEHLILTHPPTGTLVEERCGVPFRSLCCWRLEETNFVSDPLWRRLHGAISFLPAPPNSIGLPAVPLWPGFALDTLLFAALAWGLWQLTPVRRRHRRRRRGQCERCGYDRAGIAAVSPCPECGCTRNRAGPLD